jgi:hypothetical protein
MRRIDRAFGVILFLIIFLSSPLSALAQADTPQWDEALVLDLQRSNIERIERTVALAKEIRDSEAATAEAEEYLAGKHGAVPADAAPIFREIVWTAERTIRKNRRSLRRLNRQIASVEALLDALPQIGLSKSDAVAIDRWGEVNIRKAGSAAVRLMKKAGPFRLAPGDLIEIGEEGSATFVYPEAAGEMMLGSRTRAVIEEVGESKDPRVKLLQGKIRFWLGRSSTYLNRLGTKYLPRRRNRFTVSTSNMCACSVRGTSFSVEATSDGESRILVFDGEVMIVPEGSSEEIEIQSGDGLILRQDGTHEGPTAFEPTMIVAWWEEGPSG